MGVDFIARLETPIWAGPHLGLILQVLCSIKAHSDKHFGWRSRSKEPNETLFLWCRFRFDDTRGAKFVAERLAIGAVEIVHSLDCA